MEIDIPEEEMELWEEDNMETDDILCQALDEEMERQRKQDMYGGGPTHTQPAQTFQTSTPHVHCDKTTPTFVCGNLALSPLLPLSASVSISSL